MTALLVLWLLGAEAPRFAGQVLEIPADVLAKMQGVSLHEGCPVGPVELRYLRLSHYDFAGGVVVGELIVHREVAADVVAAFDKLFALRFPIERMRLVDAYGGSDDKSMEDNNTSSFNCRSVTGKPGVFSKHSYGRAIDINPRTNPYVKGKTFEPANAAEFLDRTKSYTGGIVAGDGVVAAFKSLGWGWGGDWKSLKDYQHFEKSK